VGDDGLACAKPGRRSPPIPAVAAAGALLFVAVHLLPGRGEFGESSLLTLTVGGVMAMVTVPTSALDQALPAGLLLHLVSGLARRKRPQLTLVIATVLLGVGVALQDST
jgi:prepilin signal peptidase PulO-like enzyme (type II secretory pathway)